MLRMTKFLFLPITAISLLTASGSHAVTIGFVEDFTANVAGWEDNVNNPLTHAASGGVDGGGYASTTFNYLGYTSPFGGGPVTFRGSLADNASGGAFVGDYLSEGVGGIQITFRHNAPEDLTLFMRVSSAFNFPGAVIAQTISAPANTWTDILFTVDPLSPFCIGEGVSCAAALADVANIQFGTNAPAGLVDDDFAYTLDIDKVTILPIPEPGTALLLGLGLAGLHVAGRRAEGQEKKA
jgi:hypothetical protein